MALGATGGTNRIAGRLMAALLVCVFVGPQALPLANWRTERESCRCGCTNGHRTCCCRRAQPTAGPAWTGKPPCGEKCQRGAVGLPFSTAVLAPPVGGGLTAPWAPPEAAPIPAVVRAADSRYSSVLYQRPPPAV